MLKTIWLAIVCVVALAATGRSNSRSLGLNIYGLSYHFLDDRYLREQFNEFNPGLGIRGTWCSPHNNWTTAEAGMYQDTFENTAKYAMAGYHLRFLKSLRLGCSLGLYSSGSVRNHEIIIIGTPAVSYQLSYCILNIVYLPKFRNINPFNTLGAYLTVPLITRK